MAKRKLRRRITDAYKALTKPDPLMRGHVTRSQMHAAMNSRPIQYDELVIAYYSVPAVYTCVNLKATTVAQTPFRVYRKRKGDGFKTRPVTDEARKALSASWHSEKAREAVSTDEALEEITDPDFPANLMLSKWNQVHNEYDGMYTLATWLDLAGGSYLAPILSQGVPSALIPLDVRKVWTVPDPDRGWPYVVGYRYGDTMVDATEQYQIDEIVRIGAPSIYEPFRFHSAYASAMNEIRQLYRFTEFNSTMLENGGSPGGVIKGGRWADQDQLDAFLEQIANKFGGTLNSGRFMALPDPDMSYEQLEISKELAFLNSDKEAQAKIYKAAGVPITLLEQENANLAGAVRANPQFVAIAINPMLRQIEDAFNGSADLTMGGEVFYGFDPVNAEEAEDAAETVTLYQGGLLYLNEARKRIGYDPVEGGDTFYEPPTAQTATDPFAGFFAQRAVESPQIAFDAETTPKPTEAPKALPEPTSGQTAPKHLLLTDLLYGCAPDCGCDLAEPPRGHRGTKNDRQTDTSEDSRKLEAATREWLTGFYTRAVAIAAANSDPDTIERLVIGLTQSEAPAFREKVAPLIKDVFSRGFVAGDAEVAPELGAFEVMTDTAAQAFDRRTEGLLADLGETTGSQVANVMRRAIEAGATPKEAADMLREAVPEVSASRAETIARTETSDALNAGRRQAWAEHGIQSRKFLLSSNPCELCKAVASKWSGKEIPIGEPIVKAGETIGGVTVNRDRNVPIHPRCRCGESAVVKV